ncbi:MAG TPA: tetratricopeptide repeat protein, partial [Rudaea sp.]|nr:tetratricopeptide repeat protein [Rudaea sp.]
MTRAVPGLAERISPLPLFISMLLVVLAGMAPAPRAEATVQTRNPEDLLIVDCLLPGQVRKLGTQMTFITGRTAVKTSAGDCEIRGGEYVAYDRSDLNSALRVWLPLAQSGDKVAQTYVGEIYERGLGTAPDPATAAQWYRKAAEQGYARAQVNLGFLYERGLGVPKDPRQAL